MRLSDEEEAKLPERYLSEEAAGLGECPPKWRLIAHALWKRRWSAAYDRAMDRLTAYFKQAYPPPDFSKLTKAPKLDAAAFEYVVKYK